MRLISDLQILNKKNEHVQRLSSSYDLECFYGKFGYTLTTYDAYLITKNSSDPIHW